MNEPLESVFENRDRSRFFCFALKGITKPEGWPRRLAYGIDPADALEILSYRLSKKEMRQIVKDDFVTLHHQREIPALAREGKLA